MILWAPMATRLPYPGAGGWLDNTPFRGVIHTTEGGTSTGAFNAYSSTGNVPHFTVASGGIWQHVALDQSASALAHPAGTVQTNRWRAIQIEVVGFAAQPMWSDVTIATMRKLMVWLEANCGIKPTAPTFKAYPASYGTNNGVRFSAAQWQAFNGWCGHQHVPSNAHGDPGAIPINRLLTRGVDNATVGPMYDPPIALEPLVASLKAPSGGVWLLAGSGAVYAFSAPYCGAPNGQPYWGARKAARLEAFGNGYTVVATSGERYDFPG